MYYTYIHLLSLNIFVLYLYWYLKKSIFFIYVTSIFVFFFWWVFVFLDFNVCKAPRTILNWMWYYIYQIKYIITIISCRLVKMVHRNRAGVTLMEWVKKWYSVRQLVDVVCWCFSVWRATTVADHWAGDECRGDGPTRIPGSSPCRHQQAPRHHHRTRCHWRIFLHFRRGKLQLGTWTRGCSHEGV